MNLVAYGIFSEEDFKEISIKKNVKAEDVDKQVVSFFKPFSKKGDRITAFKSDENKRKPDCWRLVKEDGGISVNIEVRLI